MKVFILLYILIISHAYSQKQGMEFEFIIPRSTYGTNYDAIAKTFAKKMKSKLGAKTSYKITGVPVPVLTINIASESKIEEYYIRIPSNPEKGFSLVNENFEKVWPTSFDYEIRKSIYYKEFNQLLFDMAREKSETKMTLLKNRLNQIITETTEFDFIEIGSLSHLNEKAKVFTIDEHIEFKKVLFYQNNKEVFSLRFVSDDSIRSYEFYFGVEVVTSPFKLENATEKKYYDAFIDVFSEIDLSVNSSTGFHLHQEVFSKGLYELAQNNNIAEIKKGVKNLKRIVTHLTQKVEDNKNVYDLLAENFKKKDRGFVKYIESTTFNEILDTLTKFEQRRINTEELISFLSNPDGLGNRYQDINFSSALDKGTVEFRFMDSTASKDKINMVRDILGKLEKNKFDSKILCSLVYI